MKIMGFNPSYPFAKKYPINCRKEQKNLSYITNPLAANFYKPISFGSQKQLSLSSLYEKGYEEIKINPDGKIKNDTNFLIINSPDQLAAIAKTPEAMNKYFVLTNDIDMSGTNFQPIGSINEPFTGVFDGNGYSIKNLSISLPKDDVGFFSSTENAKISNLALENVNIIAKNEIGALIGNAKHTSISNCVINGIVRGEVGVGGIVGIGKYNQITSVEVSGEIKANIKPKINDLFDVSSITEQISSSYFGGISAIDEGSIINSSFSNAKIVAEKNIGGIIGSTSNYIPTKINDSYFEGELVGKQNIGAIVGNSGNTLLSKCYSLGRKLIGNDTNCKNIECFNGLNELKTNSWNNWNSNIWDLTPKMLPRLKNVKEKMNPITVFLEDVNNTREIGGFPNLSQQYTPPDFVNIPIKINPPNHYEVNNKMLEKIKNCQDSDTLFKWFAEYSDTLSSDFDCFKETKNDEILLELVKNKRLPINERYSMFAGEAWTCTPLYIATRFRKPYILKEMLNRDDIDLYIKSGPNGDCDIFEVMQKYGIDDEESIFVMYSSKNPKVQKYITENLKNNSQINSESFLLDILNKTYPNIPEYDSTKGILKIPRKYIPQLEGLEVLSYDSNNNKMFTLEDVQRNMDVDINYRDSNGNNLINLSTTCKNEAHALDLYKRAKARGTSIYNRNIKGATPVSTLLQTEKNQHILSDLIKELSNPYEINEFGENAIHIFSKNPDERKGILLLEQAIKEGLSINSQDNFGNTPLMNAIDKKYYNMMNFALKNGADVNICDKNGQNALHRVCINYSAPSDLNYIYTIINQNAHPGIKDINGNIPIDYLNEETRQIVNLDTDELNAIRETFKDNPSVYSSFPTRAIQYDEYTNMLNNSNILAIDSKEFMHEKISKTTFDLSFNFDEILNNLLDVKKQDETIIRLNLELRKNIKFNIGQILEDGNNLLHMISKIHSPYAKECIHFLCQNEKININAQNTFKETPLMVAIDSYQMANNTKEKLNCMDNINALLKYSPDVNILDDNSQNVLHRICQMDNTILLSKFLDLDTNINQKDKLGKNPIEYLVYDVTNKMRIYYENYALKKNLRLGLEETLRRIK